RRLVALSPDACVIYADGGIVYVNAAGLELLRAESAGEVIGRDAMEFVVPSEREAARAGIAALIGSGVPLAPDWTLVRLDGTQIDIEVSATTFPLQGRQAIGAILRD